ncbi:MAG: choice-of-anchor D domain-containing protein, partial [Terracidiphilus sp.]
MATTGIQRNAHGVTDIGATVTASPLTVSLSNVAAGDLIVCEVSIESDVQLSSVSDPVNGAYSPAIAMHTNTAMTQQLGIFAVPNAAAGSYSVSVAWTGGARSYQSMACQSWTGVATSTPQDATMTEQQDGASQANPTAGSALTPAVAGELVIGNLMTSYEVPTTGQNYTLTDVAAVGYVWPEYWVQTAATATNTPYTNASDRWTNQMVAFKPLSAGSKAAAPVITSAASASGTVGSSFSYQIAATNSPTSYGATGLPAGLTLNSTTGLISGTLTAAGTSAVTLTATNSGGAGSASLALSVAPVLSALTCSTSSVTGAATDACTVALNAAAATGGFSVSLTSNNSSVTVPASVTVAAGATSASFSATVSSVSTAQTVTLSATAASSDPIFTLQLNAAVPTLSVSSSSVSFGSVAVNSATTQSVTLSSTGTAAVTVNSATLTGTGFSVSGSSFPLTLNPNQTVTLTVQFDPTAAGAASG